MKKGDRVKVVSDVYADVRGYSVGDYGVVDNAYHKLEVRDDRGRWVKVQS